jgi:hypothetical protein
MCVNGTKDPVRLLQAERAQLLEVQFPDGFLDRENFGWNFL